MKQPKQKSPVKSARKAAKLDIQQRLLATVKAIAAKFGEDEIKLAKKFQKNSKKLAKKISQELKIAKSAVAEKLQEVKAPSSAIKAVKAKGAESAAKTDIKTAKKPVEQKTAEKKPVVKKAVEQKTKTVKSEPSKANN
jgi:hypothetical protein